MKGKEKCKALKEIRRQIAEQNDIAYAVSECTHQGDCKGTCPKCESELRYLERELEIRKNLGKAVVVAGISAGICAPMTACSPVDVVSDAYQAVYDLFHPEEVMEGAMEYIPPTTEELAGDVEYIPPETEEIDGGLEEYDPDEVEDLDAALPSEEELAGEIPLAPSSEEDLEEIEEYILEGDIAVDPEFLDEE